MSIELQGDNFEQVNKFKYLGSIITQDGKFAED